MFITKQNWCYWGFSFTSGHRAFITLPNGLFIKTLVTLEKGFEKVWNKLKLPTHTNRLWGACANISSISSPIPILKSFIFKYNSNDYFSRAYYRGKVVMVLHCVYTWLTPDYLTELVREYLIFLQNYSQSQSLITVVYYQTEKSTFSLELLWSEEMREWSCWPPSARRRLEVRSPNLVIPHTPCSMKPSQRWI